MEKSFFYNITFNAKSLLTFLLLSFLTIQFIGLPQINIVNYVHSTITSKFIIFIYSCLTVSSAYILFVVLSKIKEAHISKLDITLLLLMSYIILNRYFFHSNYSFSIRYIELLGLSFLYVVLRSISNKQYIWLLLAIIISGIIQAIYGNLQLLGYYPSNHSGFKLTGSFFNPGPYAGFLAMVWSLALGVYLFKEKIKEQVQLQVGYSSKFVNKILVNLFEYVSLIGIVSIALIIPATRSRGAWLAIFVSSFFLLEFRYNFIKYGLKKLTHIKKVTLAFFILCIFFSGLFGAYHFKKGSADGRLFIWKVTSKIIEDFPITGVGFDRFKAHYMDYQANYFTKYGETKEALVADNSYYAFNDWLQFISENGLIGFILLAIIIYMVFKVKTVNKNKHLLLIAIGVLISFGAFALVSYPLQILPIKLVLLVAIAVLATLDIKKYVFYKEDFFKKAYVIGGLKTIIFVLGFTGLFKGVSYTKVLESTFETWKNTLTIYQYGDYKRAVINYTKAYPILKKDGDFLMNYGKALSMANQNEKAVEILKEAKQHLNTTIIETALGDAYKGIKEYNKAEGAYQHAANMIPVRFYPLYLQAKLYEQSGDKEKALIMAKTILNKDIKIPSTAIKEIKAEMRKIINREE